MAPILGYWNIRGLAQHIRLLLAYTETEFEDKLYQTGPGPDYDKSAWLNEKFNIGLDFPNLPYYIDGDVKMTQSNAIMKYIARKHGLGGETDEEKRRIDILENQIMDLRLQFAMLVYFSPKDEYESRKSGFLIMLDTKLKELSAYLGTRPWFAGGKISHIDFFIYEALDVLRLFSSTCLDDFPNLKEFLKKIESLKPIKEFMNSSRFIKYPINGRAALWGSEDTPL